MLSDQDRTDAATGPPPSGATGRLTCVVCGQNSERTHVSWAFRCAGCGTWRSSLTGGTSGETLHTPDEEIRVPGLRTLRQRNFADVLTRIDRVRPLAGRRLLDVGSAHGWFLEAAIARGADAIGIEPDEGMARFSSQRGHIVRRGFFPQVLDDAERFDIITFNDVLEHIPDVGGALDACAARLESRGVVSVNLPTSDGLAYRISAGLARHGVYGPFERLWQYGLPSPHVHYFPRAAIARLLESRGLRVRYVGPLQAVDREGLWQRIHVYRRATPGSLLTYAALYGTAPILNTATCCDIVHLVAQRV